MSVLLVTDSPAAVGPLHRVVVWLGKNHGPLPGRVTAHAPALTDFLRVVLEHVQPTLLEDFECALTTAESNRAVAEYLLERYKYASRQATFDLNTLHWTYKICALQTLQKLDTMQPVVNTLDQLENAHRDEACVIIGAGPSLDIASIDPKKILTIATTRTAWICIQAGWLPDYIIHIDPAPFEDALDDVISHPMSKNARWLIPFQVHSRFTRLPGKTYWFGSRLNPASIWISRQAKGAIRIPLIVSGGSVSCGAFTIAEFMGCSPICLIGQDLSYGGAQKYTTDDSSPGRFTSIVRDEPDLLDLPGIDGKPVSTTMDYASYAEWFVNQARHTRRKAVNCTARGVHLPGFEHLPIKAVYDRYAGRAKAAAAEHNMKVFPKIDARPAVRRARESCERAEAMVRRGDYAGAFDLITRMCRPEAEEYLISGCTQYEQKIVSYFAHLPADHPKMKRCIEIMAAANLRACDLVLAAIDGRIEVAPIDDDDVTRRMDALKEINSLQPA